ncbi:MAG: hypothetical protein ACRDIY_16175 [Chloroflexota bacterium]
MPRTARQAIRSWYASHPKTFCPVVGQCICPARGCDNPAIRADPRCNLDLKQAQAAARPAESDELRGWIYDLRDSPDGRRYLLNFGYNRALLDDFRQLIPAAARRFDPETREWAVDKIYANVLRSLFQNFDRFLVARFEWLKRPRAAPPKESPPN